MARAQSPPAPLWARRLRPGQEGARRRGALAWPVWAVAVLALAAIAGAVWQLQRARDALVIRTTSVGTTPVTVFAPAGAASAGAPVVLIAHGFAGSQQLMQPFALTLAHSGWIAVTFDFPGHGRNATPLRGGLTHPQASLDTLMACMAQMGEFARGLSADGRYAVVGHSMASDIVVRHAQERPQVQATVAVSLFAPSIQAATPPASPRNLLVIDGALEPDMMAREALRVVALGTRAQGASSVRPDVTYGQFGDGTARRAQASAGVEHIGVLYSAQTQRAARDWLDAAFARPDASGTPVDAPGPWLGLLLLGVVALAWPASHLLPRLARAPAPLRARWGWPRFAALAAIPAVLTPLLLCALPTDVLPIVLGDYLVLHFGVYGVLTALLGIGLHGGWPPGWTRPSPAWAFALVPVAAYALLAVGVPLDRYVFNMRPPLERVWLIGAMLAGTLPYFVADELLTRDACAPRGAYLTTKVLFLGSLVLAIALNLQRLFFLAIIVPAILLLFVVYGLFSRWSAARTGCPALGGSANALAFAWFMAVTFPLVA